MSESQNNYCNNCGKKGHIFHQCKIPITSIGVIIFRLLEGKRQYLQLSRHSIATCGQQYAGSYEAADQSRRDGSTYSRHTCTYTGHLPAYHADSGFPGRNA